MWFKVHENKVELRIYAKIKAKKTGLIAITEQELHVALHAVPHQGEANKELINFFAKILKLPKNQIILKRGEISRHKTVVIPLTTFVQQFLDDPFLFII